MKLTTQQLRRIIKEEVQKIVAEKALPEEVKKSFDGIYEVVDAVKKKMESIEETLTDREVETGQQVDKQPEWYNLLGANEILRFIRDNIEDPKSDLRSVAQKLK